MAPSLAKAVEYRTKTILRGGHAPLSSVKVCKAPELGLGNSLYFQFVRSMGIGCFVMMLLSFPTLFFAYYGSRMPEEHQDSMGLYRFTLGNIGYNKASTTYTADSTCTVIAPYMNNGTDTCIKLPNNMEISLTLVGSIISFMEILQIFVFFCTIYHLIRRTDHLRDELDGLITTVTDYSIMIKNLPVDTTKEELIAHFSALYPLDQADWANRPPLAGARPVQEVRNKVSKANDGKFIILRFLSVR